MALGGVETGRNRAQEAQKATINGTAILYVPGNPSEMGIKIDAAAVLLITLLIKSVR